MQREYKTAKSVGVNLQVKSRSSENLLSGLSPLMLIKYIVMPRVAPPSSIGVAIRIARNGTCRVYGSHVSLVFVPRDKSAE